MRRNPWATLAVLSVAQFIVILDVTIVNVALPDIQTDLNFTADNLQWVISAYTLLFGGLLLLGGRAADLLGARRVFLIGLAVFGAMSLLAGLATTPELLIAARAVQGLGGALLSPRRWPSSPSRSPTGANAPSRWASGVRSPGSAERWAWWPAACSSTR
ncbi:hypothetical protein GCM10027614_10060 [Micromonospora vulcania]